MKKSKYKASNIYRGVILYCNNVDSYDINSRRVSGRTVSSNDLYGVVRSGTSFRWKVTVSQSVYSETHNEVITDSLEYVTSQMITYDYLGSLIEIGYETLKNGVNPKFELLNKSWEIEVL